jgi:molybdopterin-guanine dinucleotide biosynthesis protein MobB
MRIKPIIVSVLGWSGTGKTTFIEAAIAECGRRGIDAAAVKKSRHQADLPPDTKDSARFFSAGASHSVYLSESTMIRLSAAPKSLDGATVEALCPGSAIIFCEGLELAGAHIALVAGAAASESELKRPLSEIGILVARETSMRRAAEAKNIAAFTPDDAERFIDYLVSKEIEMPEQKKEIHIYCDGKELPLVPFVSTLFYDTLAAMTKTLKGAEDASTITITLTKPAVEN